MTASVDEVRSRENDREDWAEGHQYRDYVTERWPGTKIPDYIASRLRWNEAFQKNPAACTRAVGPRVAGRCHPSEMSPGQNQRPRCHPICTATAASNGNANRRSGMRWRRSTGIVREAERLEATADLRALVREKTGLSLSKFLERCCSVDEASFNDPYSVAARFARFNGLPSPEALADEMVQAVQYQQAAEATNNWLDGFEAKWPIGGRL